MRQNIAKIRWWQALLFGIPLALLELTLFVVGMAFSSRLLPPQTILIGLPLYLVIPAIAGYWFCHQGHSEGWEGGWIGFRVGLVGCVVFILAIALVFAVIFMRYTNTPPIFNPRAPHQWGMYDPAGELRTLASTLGILALLNGIGILLSVMGGRIGGALAQWTMTAHMQRGQPQT
ncbi:MAG TPA: hypothetical protein VGF38_21010 [Ktedonobacterales bacterium]|jgi:hypothetical protein